MDRRENVQQLSLVAGLIIGNHGRALAMSDKTREHLDMFWELLDSIPSNSLCERLKRTMFAALGEIGQLADEKPIRHCREPDIRAQPIFW